MWELGVGKKKKIGGFGYADLWLAHRPRAPGGRVKESELFIEAAVGDADGVAAGLGDGELERARDDARLLV